MTEKRRPPAFQDVQSPPVYRAGLALRRGFLTGPAATAEEEELRSLILGARSDDDAGERGIKAAAARWWRGLRSGSR